MKKQEIIQTIDNPILYCNVCGKKLKIEDGIRKEDVFEVIKDWGYFSKKDLEVHHFMICEECYDEMILNFKIPIQKNYKNEVLS